MGTRRCVRKLTAGSVSKLTLPGARAHMRGMNSPFRAGENGGELLVRVTPRASVSAVTGRVALPDGKLALAARIAAPPVDGAANGALVELLARTFSLRKSDVQIVSGDGARLKRVRLSGEPAAIIARLAALA